MSLDLTTFTDEELQTLFEDVYRESRRRAVLAEAPVKAKEAAKQYAEAIGRKDGDTFVKPSGYHDAYALDAIVTHGGREWRATRHGANEVPGESPDWQEIVPEGVIPDWVQPHAGSEYPVGAKVKHKGHVWQNNHVGPNGWEPGTTGSQWVDLGPA